MINQMTTSFILCAAACLTTDALGAAPDSMVERMAPDNAVVIARIGNLEKSMARSKETSLWRLWKSDEVQKMVMSEDGQTFDEWIEEMAEEIDADPEDFVAPSGEVGLVLFSVPDDDMGMPEPGFLLYGNWNEGADKNEKLLKSILTHGQENDEWDWNEEDVNGHTVHVVEFAVPEMDEDEFQEFGGGGPEQMLQEFGKVFITRHDSAFLATSHLPGMERALEAAIDADETGIAGNSDYTHLSEMVGDNDGSVIVLFQDALDLFAGADEMGMVMMFKPLLKVAFGDINGTALAVSMDHDDAMGQFSLAIGTPDGPSGLPGLLDSESPRETLPRFVGANSSSYSRMNFEFDGLADFIMTVIRSNPLLQMQAGEMLPMIDTEVREVCATLGKEVHIVSTLSRPITIDSVQAYYAIRCIKPEAFEDKFAQLAPQMGMEPRDFLGNRLYSMPAVEGMPGGDASQFAIGIGGGFVFAGQAQGIEAALRAVNNSDSSGLAVDESFDRAISLLDETPVVGWGYTDIVDTMEGMNRVQYLMSVAMVEEMKKEFPEFAEEMEAELAAEQEAMMDYDLLGKYLGPMIWQMGATERGFLARTILLEADE